MKQVIHIENFRLDAAVRRGFRNWKSRFKEDFGRDTHLSQFSPDTLTFLVRGKEGSLFYLWDLIMNLEGMGSGFEFNELHSRQKMAVIDRYLFLLDSLRYEYMKRLGWLECYPGDDLSITELILGFDQFEQDLEAQIPVLSRTHPEFAKFDPMDSLEKKEFIRKLIARALKMLQNQSVTL
jgi:hypothetical protein